MLLLGLFSWLSIGVLTGLAARHQLPGPRLSTGAALGVGIGGALLGGLLATVLGFGGLASWDVRSFVTATLAAVLALLLLRLRSSAVR